MLARSTFATCLLVASTMHAQGQIVDANASFGLGTFPAPGALVPQPANFTASSCTANEIFEARWLWRAAGDSDATSFSDLGNGGFMQAWSGATATFDWFDADGRGVIDAHQEVVVRSTGADSGECRHQLTVTNISGAPLDLSLYFYVDFNHNGLIGDDESLTTSTGDRLQIGDADTCGGCVELWGDAPDHYELAVYPSLILALLDSGTGYDLADSGLPFGPADASGAMQWVVSLPPSGSFTAVAVLGHNDVYAGSAAVATNSGASSPGASGAPTCLPAFGPPILGGDYTLALTEPTGIATEAFALIGLGPQVAVDFCGITVHVVSPILTVTIPMNAGLGTLVYPATCDPIYVGVPILTQVLTIDPSGPCGAAVPLIASDLHTHVYGD